MSNHYVYILASQRNGTLYTGVTMDLVRRIWEHKSKIIKGFASKDDIHMLVYYEHFEGYWRAAHREKCIKDWKRRSKLELIEKQNPNWNDLYAEITGELDSGLRRNAE